MNLLKAYALQFVGLPYRWGGDDTIDGYDCSGFVQELLASCGEDPPGDQTAQGLYNWFEHRGRWNVFKCGSLCFYGSSAQRITHVAMLLDRFRVVEAGGGGSKTTTPAKAAAQNAYIRVRHIDHRADRVAVIRPHYTKIGLI